jgi:hypothetical protein
VGVSGHHLPEVPAQAAAGADALRRRDRSAVIASPRRAGNRALARLMRRAFDDEIPPGVTAGAHPLPAGKTVRAADDASVVADSSLGGGWSDDGVKTSSGRVGNVDRILLGGLSGTQGGKSWEKAGHASAGHAAAFDSGTSGTRGRAVGLVPHSMKRGGGPLSVVVHLHGIDFGKYAGTSGMRERGARPEDVEYFQIPQQLGAFASAHPDQRMIVLMPLGATVSAGKGFDVDFGITDWERFVDECLAKLGISSNGGTVYMSAHSGGGFTIDRLAKHPFRKYRFGGVFAFESFHDPDIGSWLDLVREHLDEDLKALERLRNAGSDDPAILLRQLNYLQRNSFRFAAFGGSTSGYARRVRALRSAIIAWFRKYRRRLSAAAGGHAEVQNLLWRNYQATHDVTKDRHMQALSEHSHFESVLESLVVEPGGAPATTPAKPSPAAPRPAEHHTDHKQQAVDEHRGEPAPKPKAASATHRRSTTARARPTQRLRSLQEPFQFQTWPLVTDPIELVHKGTGKHAHKRAMTGVPAEFMPAIVRNAHVPQPERFFERFVGGVTFLGREINAPIHEHLAEHLRRVERDFAEDERWGGPNHDPKLAGDRLGLSDEEIAGARGVSKTSAISMHMFGLAIDIDHKRNPYLQAHGGLPSDVFVSIRQLMEGKSKGLNLGDEQEDASTKYARLSSFNEMVIEYFGLAEPGKREELSDKLKHAAGPWKTRDVEAAQKAIKADLAALGTHTMRGAAQLREHGYLQLREELVTGLRLNWGAWYGDMMHFDMRTDGGIGESISKEIFSYLRELKALADAPDPAQ